MANKSSVLYTTVKIGDTIQIGDSTIRLEEKSGRRARLAIMSPHKVTTYESPLAQECLNEPYKGEIHGTDHDRIQQRPD